MLSEADRKVIQPGSDGIGLGVMFSDSELSMIRSGMVSRVLSMKSLI